MVKRTKRDILNAFNTLIKKYSMDKITVEMIACRADISKATFYRYYKDKYDVMNDNYKELLDVMSNPENSASYKELFENLYRYGMEKWKHLGNAFETTGKNSFCDYIETYSRRLVEEITRQNRGGTGLTAEERLQCDVFCGGVSTMYRNWIFDKYDLEPAEAAQALYDIMPRTLRDYWYTAIACPQDLLV